MRILISTALVLSLTSMAYAGNASTSGSGGISLGILKSVTASIMGVDDVSKTSASGFTIDSKSGLGGAILASILLAGPIGFTAGGLYYVRTWTDSTSGVNTISTQTTTIPYLVTVQMPLLHLGVGGYSSTFNSPFSESGAVNSNNLTAASYGIGTSDAGFAGLAGLEIPLGSAAALRLDALFLSGGKNLSSNLNNKFEVHDTIYMVGFTIGVAGTASGSAGGRTK